jgi:DNA-binding Xre family transcriptional regulator
MEKIPLRIKQLMKEKKVTQRMLAAHLGLSPSTVFKMLNNNSMNVSKLAQIADVLDVNINDLFDDSHVYHVRCPFCGRHIALAITTSIVVK